MLKLRLPTSQDRIIDLGSGHRRIGVPAGELYEEDDGEINMYLYLHEDAEQGLDPWRWLTGMDKIIRSGPDGMDGDIVLEWSRCSEWVVPPTYLVYVNEKTYIERFGEVEE